MQIGVVVARFQVDELHAAHRDLLAQVRAKADVVCVVLGVTENRGSKRNPLDYIIRKSMVESFWAGQGWSTPLVILPQHDEPQDSVWSANLDRMLCSTFPGAGFVLYGGPDSFLPHYCGNLLKQELEVEFSERATAVREVIAATPSNSPAFRRGVIYGAYNSWPRLFMCVDIALVDTSAAKIWVGKRKTEDQFRFFGGFVDQRDASLELAAGRELEEEAGISGCYNPRFLGSFKISDYRYRTPDDGLLMTALFMVDSKELPRAGDDIDEVHERSLDQGRSALVDAMMPCHRELMIRVLNTLREDSELP